MTSEEFISNCVAIIGTSEDWQARIAKQLGINIRTIQRAAKDGPSENLANLVLKLCGESAPQSVHAEWIMGQALDGREYIIHTVKPRFRALIIDIEDPDSPQAYDLQMDDGVKYSNDGLLLCGFHWIDNPPQNLSKFMEEVCDVLDEFDAFYADEWQKHRKR